MDTEISEYDFQKDQINTLKSLNYEYQILLFILKQIMFWIKRNILFLSILLIIWMLAYYQGYHYGNKDYSKLKMLKKVILNNEKQQAQKEMQNQQLLKLKLKIKKLLIAFLISEFIFFILNYFIFLSEDIFFSNAEIIGIGNVAIIILVQVVNMILNYLIKRNSKVKKWFQKVSENSLENLTKLVGIDLIEHILKHQYEEDLKLYLRRCENSINQRKLQLEGKNLAMEHQLGELKMIHQRMNEDIQNSKWFIDQITRYEWHELDDMEDDIYQMELKKYFEFCKSIGEQLKIKLQE